MLTFSSALFIDYFGFNNNNNNKQVFSYFLQEFSEEYIEVTSHLPAKGAWSTVVSGLVLACCFKLTGYRDRHTTATFPVSRHL